MNAQEQNFCVAGSVITSVPSDSTFARRMHAASIANDWLYFKPLIFDVESTGLDISDEICEIAVVDAATLGTVWQSLIKPSIPMPANAFAIHGLSDTALQDAPAFRQVQDYIEEMFKERVLLGYNVPFDLRLLVQSARIPPGRPFKLTGMASRCVMQLYAYWWGEYDERRGQYRWEKLQNVCLRHGLQTDGEPHRALADAQLTGKLLQFIANYRPLPGEECEHEGQRVW